MSSGHDPLIARWIALPSPLAAGERITLDVRDGFWKHAREHVANRDEYNLWCEWLGQPDAEAIRRFSWKETASERCDTLRRASTILEKSVRASFSVPLLVLCRAGPNATAAASAAQTCVAVLENAAKFVSKDARGVLAATCYFSPFECQGIPKGSWYRVIAMRIVFQYRRTDNDLSRTPEAAHVFTNPNWEQDGRFRTDIKFVTDQTWGFDGTGKPRPISRFANFPARPLPDEKLVLRPRPMYRGPEDQQ